MSPSCFSSSVCFLFKEAAELMFLCLCQETRQARQIYSRRLALPTLPRQDEFALVKKCIHMDVSDTPVRWSKASGPVNAATIHASLDLFCSYHSSVAFFKKKNCSIQGCFPSPPTSSSYLVSFPLTSKALHP